MLDQDPTSSHESWLVACSVAASASGDRLSLRNTTLLPELPGMGPLLAMIFSPVLEMRANQERTKYTGFVAGLGFRHRDWGRHKRSGVGQEPDVVAYYSEHDMEVILDVEVSKEDIGIINDIRQTISKALSEQHFGSGQR